MLNHRCYCCFLIRLAEGNSCSVGLLLCLCECLSVRVRASFPFDFEGGMWD